MQPAGGGLGFRQVELGIPIVQATCQSIFLFYSSSYTTWIPQEPFSGTNLSSPSQRAAFNPSAEIRLPWKTSWGWTGRRATKTGHSQLLLFSQPSQPSQPSRYRNQAPVDPRPEVSKSPRSQERPPLSSELLRSSRVGKTTVLQPSCRTSKRSNLGI